jgi:hypothetical protein
MFNLKQPLIALMITISLALAACKSAATSPPIIQPTPVTGLSQQQTATLASLQKVDDYPLYVMHYYGTRETGSLFSEQDQAKARLELAPAWGCSLFAAMGGADKFYGRNFDWEMSPALLLFYHPASGYDSVSMVDMAYLDIPDDQIDQLTSLSIAERQALLAAPALPFDGMNERGLVVGMAAVPPGDMEPDPNKETIGSLGVMRKMLDQASSVDEAVAILQQYNVDFESGDGPPLHYLIADRSGRAVLVEFYEGSLRLLPNEEPWHFATNFLRSAVQGSTAGQCPRYDKLDAQLASSAGSLDARQAMSLLEDVAQSNTQWSIVYGFSTGDITVSMAGQYDSPHTFYMPLTK